ncbi:MAG: glycosyltransferase family 39 protein [bacterium]|nr:glycosyltransferase family 39 protein [bacterium]
MNLLQALNTRTGFVVALLVLTALSAALRGIVITHPPTRVFDEVYSPVFAWKFLHHEPFFDVHPFLTQFSQTVGLLLFGDTPLGWRFSAWLWGSVFIAGIGVFANALTGRRLVGVLASVLAMLDIAFFVYGRTGLPDMFLLATFVWALAFFFLSARVQRTGFALVFALISGGLLGNLVATKWLGLGAIVLVWIWIGAGLLRGQRWPIPLPRIPQWLLPVCFLLVPILTYLLWTIPVVGIPGHTRAAVGEELFQTPCTFGTSAKSVAAPPTTWLGRVRHWHCTVWNYHAQLTATHPYGSPWWSWPILKHPVLFYLDTSATPTRRVSATGNPVLWWTGFAAVIGTTLFFLFRFFRFLLGLASGRASTDRAATVSAEGGGAREEVADASRAGFLDLWLVLGILGFWLPWALIQRVAFHYHYFLSFTLTVVLLAFWLARFLQHPRLRSAVFGFLLATLISFVYLYPSATATSAPWLR